MATLDIRLYGDPILRRKASPVSDPASVRALAADLFETMYAARGVGLAAPQVGRSVRLFVVVEVIEEEPDDSASGPADEAGAPPDDADQAGLPDDAEQAGPAGGAEPESPRPIVLRELAVINPVILERSGVQIEPAEGCLSIPGVAGHVERAERIVLRYQALDGLTHTLTAEGYLARAIQHELDHLDGVLFIDRMDPDELAEQRDTLAELQRETRLRLRELERPRRA
jgi:peptide deformylase